MDLKKQILVALGLDKEEVMMAFQTKLEDGTIITSTAETLEAGVDMQLYDDCYVVSIIQKPFVLYQD